MAMRDGWRGETGPGPKGPTVSLDKALYLIPSLETRSRSTRAMGYLAPAIASQG